MKIGITCYPTFGGSGVVATELGIALAKHGDDVHFISYAMPSRLNVLHERVHFHEVNVTPYPLFDPYPPYALALATKMTEVAANEKLDILRSLRDPARDQRAPREADPQVEPESHHDVARHRHHARRPRRELSADHEVRHRSVRRRDRGVAVARDETAANFHTDKAIEVIPNFVDPRASGARSEHVCGAGRKLVCHVSNFRPVKRVMDVCETFLRIVQEIPAKLLMIGDGPDRSRAEAFAREHNLRDRFCLPRQRRTSKKSSAPATCSCCRRMPSRSAWLRSRRWRPRCR
jgi:glycosyltransferase involved in cell wall biosynthesis